MAAKQALLLVASMCVSVSAKTDKLSAKTDKLLNRNWCNPT